MRLSPDRTPALSLYVHLPWCIKKCPYCDFNSHQVRETPPFDAYLKLLLEDLRLELARPSVQGRLIETVFFGGGTPSLFAPRHFKQLINALKHHAPTSPQLEVTMEANPGALEHQAFAAYKEAGITRISLGVQSFNDAALKRLGRVHGADEAYRALASITEAGFSSFNVDLMYGLPHQTFNEALFDLQEVLRLGAPHVSWYHLSLEPHTLFYHQPPVLPPMDEIARFQEAGDALISPHLQKYEVSAFAKPHHHSRHNVNYWQFGDYIGIGAGAHGKLSCSKTQQISRTIKTPHPKQYLQGHLLFSEQVLSKSDLPFEFMLNALRLEEACDFALFTQRTYLAQDVLLPALDKGVKQGLLTYDEKTIRLKCLGKRFLNDTMALFLGASSH